MGVILFERRGPVALITINRPEATNALDFAANDELIEAWKRVRDDRNLRAAVITGAGDKAFCAGADLKTYTMDYARRGVGEIRAVTNGPGFGGISRGFDIFKPVVAAINGYCISGGLELALACDVRLASPNAEFAHQDVRWGFHPCDGGTQRLAWVVGLGRALELVLSGDRIGAEEAYRIGLVNHIYPYERLVNEALRLAERMASRAPLAVQAAKEVMLRGLGRPLEEGLRMESWSFYQLKDTGRRGARVRGEANAGVPRAIASGAPMLQTTVGDLFRKAVHHYRDRVAVKQGSRAITYPELGEQVNRLANALLGLGLARGDRVALLMGNCPEYVICDFAVATAGLVKVPLNHLLTRDDVAFRIQDAEAAAVICDGPFATMVQELTPACPSLRHRICVVEPGGRPPQGFVLFDRLLAQASARDPGVEVAHEDLVGIMYTGGDEMSGA